MPEFILNTEDAESAFAALDAFTQGYIEAAFFTECNCDNEELDGASVADIAPASLAEIVIDCAEWQAANAALLSLAYERDDYSPEQAGRDYWFTRNGHGVGFWDRAQLENDSAEYEALTAEMVANRANNAAWNAALAKRQALPKSLGARLSDAAGQHEIDVYRADDSLIYFG